MAAGSGSDDHMLQVPEIHARRLEMARDEFVRHFAHPFLIRRLEDAEIKKPLTFGTQFATHDPDAEPGRRLLSGQLRSAPDRFGIYLLKKVASNPWSDRITVGRATNNDLVLRNASVSKLHAFFSRAERAWTIHDCNASNKTRVNGAVLERGGQHPLSSGDMLSFGLAECEFIEAQALYVAL